MVRKMLCTIHLIAMYPYASRRLAKFSALADYRAFESEQGLFDEAVSFENFNFVEGNGLETEIIVNDAHGDNNYVLVCNGDAILSRWYVIEKTRITNYADEQYRLTLRRDVLADYLDSWVNNPSFINKGRIVDRLNPLLFNKEDMSFNAIKRREIQIPDETGIQWIVGYIARNATLTDEAKKLNGAIAESPVSEGTPAANAIEFATLDDFYNALGLPTGTSSFSVIHSASATACIIHEHPNGRKFAEAVSKDADGNCSDSYSNIWATKTYESALTGSSLAAAIMGKVDVADMLKTVLSVAFVSPKDFANMCRYAGRTVFIASAKRNYAVQITPTAVSAPKPKTITAEQGDQLFSAFDNSVASSSGSGITSVSGSWQTGSFLFSYVESMSATVSLAPLNVGAIQVSLTDPALRPHLEDAPYDMFCIPYGAKKIKTAEGEITSSTALAWQAAVALVENLSQGTYDLQLLPYCPQRGLLVATNAEDPTVEYLDCSGMTVDFAYSGTVSKTSSGEYEAFTRTGVACPIIWCTNSNFSFIASPDLTDDFAFPSDPLEVKVRNETTKARLVSPNLSGGFDFSPMMNGGVSQFRVDCTYRPFNPYIHVAPVFAHMYGGDFQDARGLVCGGDFSLPRITDSWEQYQQSNKNYQAIFDREIQNLEVAQKHQAVSEAFGAAAGVGQGAMSGALAGSIVPGLGTAVGAGVGAAASLAGGIADLAIGNALRAEAVDYRKDLFGYQLGNIRALPYSLAKSAAQNANNRPFPFVELYKASDEETAALRSKIEYDGMSVGVIGKPSDYIAGYPCYIQCAPAACDADFREDSDLWNAVCAELQKGVYVYQEAES